MEGERTAPELFSSPCYNPPGVGFPQLRCSPWGRSDLSGMAWAGAAHSRVPALVWLFRKHFYVILALAYLLPSPPSSHIPVFIAVVPWGLVDTPFWRGKCIYQPFLLNCMLSSKTCSLGMGIYIYLGYLKDDRSKEADLDSEDTPSFSSHCLDIWETWLLMAKN